MQNIIQIAQQFNHPGKVIDVQKFGQGNINNTFLVTLDSPTETYFVLQRINTQVFHQPELIMRNMNTFTNHVRSRLEQNPLNLERRWEVPRVILTHNHQEYWLEEDNSFWRAISFIDRAESFDTIKDKAHGQEVGYALGMFHNLIVDLPTESLSDTLEGFHITPGYLKHYQEVLNTTKISASREVNYCCQFIEERQVWAHVLENALIQGKLQLRPIHGDPKINNILLDVDTKKGIGMIDLDTVKPGLVHYDIGDCLRSCCNPLGEETQDWEQVFFDTDLCQSVLQGYLSVGKNFLTTEDYAYIYDSIRLLSFELGLRFFTDHLAGNVYFKTKYSEHNLARALVQFKLTESIEAQENIIRQIIQTMASFSFPSEIIL